MTYYVEEHADGVDGRILKEIGNCFSLMYAVDMMAHFCRKMHAA